MQIMTSDNDTPSPSPAKQRPVSRATSQTKRDRSLKRRGVGPANLRRAGALGKMVLPLMQKRGVTHAELLQRISEISGEPRMHRHRFSGVMYRTDQFVSIRTIFHIAEALNTDPIPLVAAYIEDSTAFYPDFAILTMFLQETNPNTVNRFVQVDETWAKPYEGYIASLVSLMYLLKQVPTDKYKDLIELIQTFIRATTSSPSEKQNGGGSETMIATRRPKHPARGIE